MKDPGVKQFIEKCISKVSERLPARELLLDPFLQPDGENETVGHSLQSDMSQSGRQFLPSERSVPSIFTVVIVEDSKPLTGFFFLK